MNLAPELVAAIEAAYDETHTLDLFDLTADGEYAPNSEPYMLTSYYCSYIGGEGWVAIVNRLVEAGFTVEAPS